jgi:hypothetical protein
MKKLLTTLVVLTAIGSPAFAQYARKTTRAAPFLRTASTRIRFGRAAETRSPWFRGPRRPPVWMRRHSPAAVASVTIR